LFHGQGATGDDEKETLLRYFQQVDSGLSELLADEQAPLVLAGVDYLLPIYRQASSYPHIIDGVITGNPDNLTAAELHTQAQKIVQPYLEKGQRKAVKRYRRLSSTGSDLASSELEEILSASHHGRVDTLFTRQGEQVWGDYQPRINEIRIIDVPSDGSQDLLDLAAVKTLSNAGQVYVLPSTEMPDQALIAALFRFSYKN
jgi:hypothetical protein